LARLGVSFGEYLFAYMSPNLFVHDPTHMINHVYKHR